VTHHMASVHFHLRMDILVTVYFGNPPCREPSTVSMAVVCPDSFGDSVAVLLVYILTSLLIYFLKNRPLLFSGLRL